ncbi:MAG: NAD-dependent epimerase/dehydratase family protein [Bacteroidia bacterium]
MILVTGGTGLVGSHLLYELVKSGKVVRALKRKTSSIENVKKVFSYYTTDAELINKIDWVEGDVLDISSLLTAMEAVEIVYHCAAMVSFEKKHLIEMMQVNVEGTANVVNTALEKKIKKMCYVSSIATLQKTNNTKFIAEEFIWKFSPDLSNYAISKYQAEREVWRASEEGLAVIIVNPSVIVGGGNWSSSSANMFSKAFNGLKFYTDGATGFIDVRDVATLMVNLTESTIKNERFILNSENGTYRYFFNLIHDSFEKTRPHIKAGKFLSSVAWRMENISCLITGNSPLITKETARSAHHINYFSNHKILQTFPDYQFIGLRDSINHTCNLFLKEVKAL